MQDGENNETGRVFKPGDQPTLPADSTPPPPELPDTSPEPDVPQENFQTPEPEETSVADDGQVEWTASEFIDNQKSAGWFGLLAISSVVLAAVIYIISKDIVSTVVIIVLGVIVAIFANHKPKALTYQINSSGITISGKHYEYESFKSFSVGSEQAMSFISLMPVKRFMPPITIHYSPEDEEKIVQTLADYLPFEEHKQDIVDRLSKKFRF